MKKVLFSCNGEYYCFSDLITVTLRICNYSFSVIVTNWCIRVCFEKMVECISNMIYCLDNKLAVFGEWLSINNYKYRIISLFSTKSKLNLF